MAQLVAHLLCKQRVAGSNPASSTSDQKCGVIEFLKPHIWLVLLIDMTVHDYQKSRHIHITRHHCKKLIPLSSMQLTHMPGSYNRA